MAKVQVKLGGDINAGPVATDEDGEFFLKLSKRPSSQTRYYLNGVEAQAHEIRGDQYSVTITHTAQRNTQIQLSGQSTNAGTQVYTVSVIDQKMQAVPNVLVIAGGRSYTSDASGLFYMPVPIPKTNTFLVNAPLRLIKVEREDAEKAIKVLVQTPNTAPVEAVDTAAVKVYSGPYSNKIEELALSLETEQLTLTAKAMDLRREIAQLATHLSQERNLSAEEKSNIGQALSHLKEALAENDLEYQRSKERTQQLLGKIQEDLNLANQQKEAISKKSRQQLAFFLLVTLALMGLVLIFLFISDRMRRQKEEMQAVKQELEVKVTEIDEKNKQITVQAAELQQLNQAIIAKSQKITDSLLYARAVQEAILPPVSILTSLFPDHFLVSRSKDIVSGDFHWIYTTTLPGGVVKTFLAVVDCTGHGLSSGFYSMVAHALLSEIVQVKSIHEPKQILKELSEGVRATFHQNEILSKEGMEVCLCAIEQHATRTKLVFSGAKRPLLHVKQNKEGVYYKGDMHSITAGANTHEVNFCQTEVTLQKGDIICLSSDGFSQQGTQSTGKIGVQQLLDTLVAHAAQPLSDQASILEGLLETYQVRDAQRDDILVLAVRI
jgi:serine phosphatase RsbU (regulator of sigma subunit)